MPEFVVPWRPLHSNDIVADGHIPTDETSNQLSDAVMACIHAFPLDKTNNSGM